MNREDCAIPTWANLFFVDVREMILFNGSVGFHGLPRVGDIVDIGDHCGIVTTVKWARVVEPGELKPTVWVQVTDA